MAVGKCNGYKLCSQSRLLHPLEFQDPEMDVPTVWGHITCGDILIHIPYIDLLQISTSNLVTCNIHQYSYISILLKTGQGLFLNVW